MSETATVIQPDAGGPPDFLAGGGEMGALMRSLNWSNTPLGSPRDWPQSLRTATSIMLNSRYPMFLAWGPELAFIYNDGYRPIFGDKHPEALGQPFAQVWSEIWADISPLVERALAGEPTFSEDLLLFMERRGYPEEVYFTFSYSPIRDETGGVGGMFCACTETTRSVLDKRRLKTLSGLTAAAAAAQIKNVPETQTACLKILEGNREDIPFAILFRFQDGQSEPRMAGSAGDIASGMSEASRWPLADVKQGESIAIVDLATMFAEPPASAWSEPTRSAVILPIPRREQGEVSAALVLGINPRRAYDDEYRLFFERVAGVIASATANAQSYEGERRRAEALAEIDRAKTAFFSNVSHEFRTPLTLMLGPLEDALRRRDIAGQEREELAVVHRNSLRLLKLVNSLLDFSRVEAGRVQAVYRATDLSSLTTDLASSFRSACERAGILLEIDCTRLPHPVYVDQDMWEKIVLNLLSNAFKFTFEGKITVSLRAQGSAAELTVQDTGIGIPEQEMPRLFERFHRIESSHGRTHEGTGIGLALVQELVKLHGGTVKAESAHGEGSAFTVRIPFGMKHLPFERIGADRTQASTATRAGVYVEEALRWLDDKDAAGIEKEFDSAMPPAAADDRERPRILLADDNADMRDYVRRLLSSRYDVEAVADGQTALAAAHARRPDLILSDVMMPRLDGFGLLRAIRSDDALKDVPVVMLSARAGEDARIDGLNAGADDYLTKPFSARELVARVNANLELSRVRREAVQTLRDSEARFRNMADNAPVMVWTTDVSGSCTFLSRSWYEFTGQTPETGLGFGWLDATHPDDRPQTERLFREANEARKPFRLEYRLRRADGEYRWAIDAAAPWFGVHGELIGYIGSVIDITERKDAEEQQNLLLGEMSHRIKNLFAVTGGLVMLSARSARTPAEMALAVRDRLNALTQAHELTRPGLTGKETGAGRNTTLHRLIDTIMAPYLGDRKTGREGLIVTGGDLPVSEGNITNLALVLHELATNAAKYGALSVPGGMVHVDCASNGGVLMLTWEERGGPAIVGEPQGEGFGGLLARRIVRDQFGGRFSREWTKHGLIARIEMPRDRLV